MQTETNSFWKALAEVPVLRLQLVEISQAQSRDELVLELCFKDGPALSEFMHGPLARRARRVGGDAAVNFLLRECGRMGV